MVVFGMCKRCSDGLDPLRSRVCQDVSVSCFGERVVLVVEWKLMVLGETRVEVP